MSRNLAAAVMALAFLPLVVLIALGAAGWFSRIWWRALREVWRSGCREP
jgi:hypothetical protein